MLIAGGLVLWYRQLLAVASPNDREFLLALLPALLVYALTDNVLIYSSALAIYAYLGVVLTLPLAVRGRRCSRPRHGGRGAFSFSPLERTPTWSSLIMPRCLAAGPRRLSASGRHDPAKAT